MDIAKLLPQHKDKILDPLEFNFQVAGRELSSVAGNFNLIKPDDPKFLQFDCTITFTEDTKLEDVQRSTRLRVNSQNLELTFEPSSDGRNFTFRSPVVERTSSDKKFELEINKTPLELSENFKRQVLLPALSEMIVTEISIDMDDDHAELIVNFSDELDPHEDLRGLIRIEPQLDINLKTMGKDLYISGDFGHGQEYTVIISTGIRSRWGIASEKEHVEKIQIQFFLK